MHQGRCQNTDFFVFTGDFMSHTQYAPARQRLQRSELAVPGSNPGMFEKAAASNADYVFLDLEDAVAPGDKEQARAAYRTALEGNGQAGGSALLQMKLDNLGG